MVEQVGADAKGDRLRRRHRLACILLELLAQQSTQLHDPLAARTTQQNDELITTQPRGQRALGQHRANHLAQGNQQAVPCNMPVQVVDQLEVVDVDQ
ncbi:hypothetical protein D3C71_1498940 [compost metagenome]